MPHSPSPFPKQNIMRPLKRKERSEDREADVATTQENGLPPGASIPKGEYASGLIMCDVCGTMVSFRNEATGEFTLRHWNHHRETCILSSPSNTITTVADPVVYVLESTEALARPPTLVKRRRVKRSEAERIAYLRDDPYVAQFEAYRALCASCDKWIRLRPNSTYCSIPWEAHRKGCLARKTNVHSQQERDQLFAKDPGVRKFDAKGVLCAICNTWVAVHPDRHAEAVDKWLQHRSVCQKATVSACPRVIDPKLLAIPTPASEASTASSTVMASPSALPPRLILPAPKPPPQRSPVLFPFILCNPHPTPLPSPGNVHQSNPHPSNPANSYGPVNPSNPVNSSSLTLTDPRATANSTTLSVFPILNYGSQRRSAEQRAASLRADRLITSVEPNRVFCSVCHKWVQLRRDSAYCSYPWIQHRGKCLARAQRQSVKQNEAMQGRNHRQSFGFGSSGSSSSGSSTGAGAGTSFLHAYGRGPTADVGTGRLSTDSDESESDRDSRASIRMHKSEGRRSTSRVQSRSNSSVISQDDGYDQHAHYQRYHHLANYQRVERLDYPRRGPGDGQCRYHSHPRSQPRRQHHQYQHRGVDVDVKPFLLSSRLGTPVHLYPSSRGSSIQTTAYHSDARSYSSAPEPRLYSSSEITSSDDSVVHRRPNLDSLSGRKIFIHTSITYLFSTTFDYGTDVLSVQALVAYLNAAMPPDQWEDFDDGEVRSALDGGSKDAATRIGRGSVWGVKEGDGEGGEEVVRVRE